LYEVRNPIPAHAKIAAIMKITRLFLLITAWMVFTTSLSNSQSVATPSCELSMPKITPNAENIFNDRQEQDLGDAWSEVTEPELTLLPESDKLSVEIQRMGEKLLATLPPTGVKYRFRIYDSGELNAFSMPGGRVYISRKLITAVGSEDELAGVIAHEIGHIIMHQSAIEISKLLKLRLGITQLGDRADVFLKVHQLFDTPSKKSLHVNETEDDLAADQVALYAMLHAGYAPNAYSAFFNKITVNKGKTTHWYSDLMGTSDDNSKRYTIAVKTLATLPAECKAKQASQSPEFLLWQKSLIEERIHLAASGDIKEKTITLEQPLRSSLTALRFSPDGKYVLAQDESIAYVIDRANGKIQVNAEAPDSYNVMFTPDSKDVVIYDPKLRIEKWNIETGQRDYLKEMVLYDSCGQILLLPDAQTLFCANIDIDDHYELPRVRFRLIDVESGKTLFEKKNMFEPERYQYSWIYSLIRSAETGRMFASTYFTYNGHYFFATIAGKKLIYDAWKHGTVEPGGKLKPLYQNIMSFVGDDKLFVGKEVSDKDSSRYVSYLLSFPEGKVIKEMKVVSTDVYPTTKSDSVLIGDLKGYAIAAYDTKQEKFTLGSQLRMMDVWENISATESATGGVAIRALDVNAQEQRLNIPTSDLPAVKAVVISSDGKYLALSLAHRAEFWNLETGKSIGVTRPFYSCWFDSKDQLWGNFQKVQDKLPASLKVSMEPFGATPLNPTASVEKHDADAKDNQGKSEEKPNKDESKDDKKDEDKNGYQYGNLAVFVKPLGKNNLKRFHVSFEAKLMENQQVAWTREFEHEAPVLWPADGGRMLLAWDLSNAAVKDEIKNNPEMTARYEEYRKKKKGLLLEIIAMNDGKVLQQVIVPEADFTQGWDDERRAVVAGNFILAYGEHDNMSVYKFDGTRVGEFFGQMVSVDVETNTLVAYNRKNELILFTLDTVKEIKRISFSKPVRSVRVVTNEGKYLYVLTSDQVIRKIQLDDLMKPLTSDTVTRADTNGKNS
jgi:WD40 repeat protein